MKNLASALLLHLKGNLQTLCTCWRIERLDGVVKTYTSAQRSLVIDGLTYKAINGTQPSAVESQTTLAVGNLEIEGLLNSGEIEAGELASGRYDGAVVAVFIVNRKDLTQGKLSMRLGSIGEVKWQQGKFTCEVRGLEQKLTQNIVELTSKTCRASLGDARCTVSMTGKVDSATVATVGGNRVLTASLPRAYGEYQYGVVTFTSGSNTGVSMEVKSAVDAGGGSVSLGLVLPMPHAVAAGDHFNVSVGCSRDRDRCKQFGNVPNFRGEPDIPDTADLAKPH